MKRLTQLECEHEADVLAAVATGRWAEDKRVDPALRAHAATCDICADALAVAAAFREDDAQSQDVVHLSDSSVVWWRAQMRARAEAARTASRPFTVIQVAGLSAIIGVAGALFGATSSWFQGLLVRLWTSIKSVNVPSFELPTIALPAPIIALVTEHALVVGMVAAVLILAPIAVYFAAKE
jgi:hypothetical protein